MPTTIASLLSRPDKRAGKPQPMIFDRMPARVKGSYKSNDVRGYGADIYQHAQGNKKYRCENYRRYSEPSRNCLPYVRLTVPKETPAMNAPTIADKPMSSASIAYRKATIIVKINTSSGYCLTSGEWSIRSIMRVINTWPMNAPIMIKPNAFKEIQTRAICEMVID